MNFIADVHLGKLAKLMRLLGFDTLYNNLFTNSELVSIAINEHRILLSRNDAFRKNAALQSFIIASEDAATQLQQVITHFNLKDQRHPFTRCLLCNGILKPVSKNSIADQLQQNTIAYFNEFWQCDECRHIYWKGSHYDRMLRLLEKLDLK